MMKEPIFGALDGLLHTAFTDMVQRGTPPKLRDALAGVIFDYRKWAMGITGEPQKPDPAFDIEVHVTFRMREDGRWYWRVEWLGRTAANTHENILDAIDGLRAGVLWVAYPAAVEPQET